MINKFDDIKLFLSIHTWSFIFVSETWFTKEVEKLYCLDCYQLFCASRPDKPGGGSAIYVHENLVAKQITLSQFSTAEAVFLNVKVNNHINCLIIQIYRAPRNNTEFLSELEKCLIEATKMKALTYIVGDFNADLFSVDHNSFDESFFTLMCSYGFLPTISKATRVSNDTFTLIDNIFCNDFSFLYQSGVIKTDFSDHFSIFSSSSINLDQKHFTKNTRVCFDYHYIDALNEYLVNELQNFQSETNPENACNMLIESYTKGVAKFSKAKQLTRKNNAIQPWVTSGLLNSINQKNLLFAAKLRNPCEQNVSKYNAYRNSLNSALRTAKKHYYKTEFTKYQNNPKQTWETMNHLLQRKTFNNELPYNFVSDLGEDIDNDTLISEGFNKYFADRTEVKNKLSSSDRDPIKNVKKFVGDEMVLTLTSTHSKK